MSLSDEQLRELDDVLSRLPTVDEKAAAFIAYTQTLDDLNPSRTTFLRAGGGNTAAPSGMATKPDRRLYELLLRHAVDPQALLQARERLEPRFSLERAPCAYINPGMRAECLREGTSVCSGCKLVKYCSKECQKRHWKIHSSDCKDFIRSTKWQPAWVLEKRPPMFITIEPQPRPLSRGYGFWGNMPAIDILKLPENKKTRQADLNLAFTASGDLRNVISTVNGLPLNYDGQLTVLINDANTHVTLRNIIMLQILGTMPDKTKAADVALHLWYSARVPAEYHIHVVATGSQLLSGAVDEGPVQMELGPRAKLVAAVNEEMKMLWATLAASSVQYTLEDAMNNLSRVRFDPAREDLRHRFYYGMDPSHRLAFLEFHRFGFVLPFGAHNAHFNTPNRFLFSPLGEWLLWDGDNPLHGWDVEEVVRSGRAHGATREDIYGCLYFHVTDQLKAFADRLSKLNISFKVLDMEMTDLAHAIRSGRLLSMGVPRSIVFDRIDVSNVMDAEYVGICGVIDAWGGLLKRTGDAALIGYFMNWPGCQPNGQVSGCPKSTMDAVREEAIRLNRIPLPDTQIFSPEQAFSIIGALMSNIDALDSLYDNSKAFETYLTNYGLDAALRRSMLKRRHTHTMAPHRLCTSVGDIPSALPQFKDDESWYLQSQLGVAMWHERYIEIIAA